MLLSSPGYQSASVTVSDSRLQPAHESGTKSLLPPSGSDPTSLSVLSQGCSLVIALIYSVPLQTPLTSEVCDIQAFQRFLTQLLSTLESQRNIQTYKKCSLVSSLFISILILGSFKGSGSFFYCPSTHIFS